MVFVKIIPEKPTVKSNPRYLLIRITETTRAVKSNTAGIIALSINLVNIFEII